MSKPKWDFRDISKGLKIFRDILLGRKHNLHGRFPPLMSPSGTCSGRSAHEPRSNKESTARWDQARYGVFPLRSDPWSALVVGRSPVL
uniref:Uncharacterized protein n=1 Tax=Bombyx mori TaxID=7091 RepID=A0A8R2HMZ1_BOMMO|nr:uncharacterized protein LOC101735561 isoform X2 [Bombyx mori]